MELDFQSFKGITEELLSTIFNHLWRYGSVADAVFRALLCSHPYLTVFGTLTVGFFFQACFVLITARRVFGTAFPSKFVKNQVIRQEVTNLPTEVENPNIEISQGQGEKKKRCSLAKKTIQKIISDDGAVELQLETKRNVYGVHINDPTNFGRWLEDVIPILKSRRHGQSRSVGFWRFFLIAILFAAASYISYSTHEFSFSCPPCEITEKPCPEQMTCPANLPSLDFPPCDNSNTIECPKCTFQHPFPPLECPVPKEDNNVHPEMKTPVNSLQVSAKPSRFNMLLNVSFVGITLYLLHFLESRPAA